MSQNEKPRIVTNKTENVNAAYANKNYCKWRREKKGKPTDKASIP